MSALKEINTKKEFEKIYLLYYSRLKRFAKEYVVAEEDAENILQDVFLEFWEKREVLLTYTNLIAFLFTTIRNRSIDCLRRRVLEQEAARKMQETHTLTLQMNLDSLQALDEDVFSQNHIEEIITKAIDELPEKCRQVFILSKIEGVKQKEIAAKLNISVNTVESHMNTAYKKLKENLKDYYPLFFFLFIW